MAIPNLRGKLALVTGAASGIGHAMAMALAREGARVIATDVNPERLAPALRDIRAAGGDPLAEVIDVADEAAMERLAKTLYAKLGPLDVLINNAGIGYLGAFLDTPSAAWRRVLDINVLGVVNGCRAFLPQMMAAAGARRIVNIASAAAFAPAVNMAAYAASKYAVMGISDVLAMELEGSNVGVTAVCPGIIDTAITAGRANVASSITDQQLDRLRNYYRTKGTSADVVAHAVVEGIRSGRDLVLVGPKARPSYHAKRLSRALTLRLSRAESKAIGFV